MAFVTRDQKEDNKGKKSKKNSPLAATFCGVNLINFNTKRKKKKTSKNNKKKLNKFNKQ